MFAPGDESEEEILIDHCADYKKYLRPPSPIVDPGLEILKARFKELLRDTREEDDSQDDASSPLSESQDDETQVDDDESEDEFEVDENGCVLDFNIIADVLDDRLVGNKTFTDMEVREIERKNSILMKKILRSHKRPSQYKTVTPSFTKVSNSYVNRKKQQQKIERENMLMLRRIEGVKPFGKSKPSKK